MEMTQEWKDQFNKKCAEFLEIPNLKDYKGDLWDYQRTNEKIYSIRTNELSFHRDWNRIMDVIEKILQSGSNEPSEINGKIFYFNHFMGHQIFGNKSFILEKINEFIDYYNTQKT